MVAYLPRHLSGATPSALVHNTASAELDALSRTLTVARIRSADQVEGALPPNIDVTVPWEQVTAGVNRGSWSSGMSPHVRIVDSGTYLMLLQLHYPADFGDRDLPSVFGTGRRWARIMLNGTSPLSDTIGQGVRRPAPAADRLAGVTVQALACRSLQAGDVLQCGFRSSHSGTQTQPNAGIRALGQQWGGSYFTIARIGPGAGTLVPDVGGGGGAARFESRSLPPAETLNVFAQAIDNLGVCAKPRRTSGVTLAPNVAQVLSWQADGLDTRGDMWDPAEPTKVVVRISGTYFLELRATFPASGGSASGERSATLHRNSFAAADVLARDDGPGGTAYEGSYRVTRAIVRLSAGDVLYASISSTVACSAASPDAGGTYLFAARIGRSGEGGSILEGQGYGVDPITDDAFGAGGWAESVRADVVASIGR